MMGNFCVDRSSRLPYYRMVGYVVTIAMHTINVLVMLNSFRGDVMEDPNIQLFSTFMTRFITCWTFCAQSAHAALGLSCDILTLMLEDQEEHKFLKYLKQLRNLLFASIVVPYTFMVSTVFWPIFLYDREFILPTYTTKIVGSVSNHIMHTAIVPATLWEMVFQPREATASHRLNFALLSSYSLVYLAVVFITYYEVGVFPYPLMTMLYGTVYFLIGMFLVLMWLPIYYFGQWPLTNLLWGTARKAKIY